MIKALEVLVWVMLILLPIAAVEFLTGKLIINSIVGGIFRTFEWNGYAPRLGFYRVQATFEHPILYGVFASSVFSLFFFAFKGGKFPASSRTAATISLIGTVFSVSSGAFISVAFQCGLQVWEKVTKQFKHRWWLLIGVLAIAYVAIDIYSTRDPIVALASHAAIDKQTAYFRVMIWSFGIDNILDNPIFGLGLNDWVRPSWMPPSVDSFWLLTTMRHGLPAIFILILMFILILNRTAKKKIESKLVNNIRRGYLYSILGMFLSLCTVHVWNTSYAYFLFLVGSGVWIFANYKEPQNKSKR